MSRSFLTSFDRPKKLYDRFITQIISNDYVYFICGETEPDRHILKQIVAHCVYSNEFCHAFRNEIFFL